MNRQCWLAAILAAQKPSNVLMLRHSGQLGDFSAVLRGAGVESVLWQHAVTDLTALAPLGRFELAVVADQLEQMSAQARRHLLVRLRDLHARHVAVCARAEIANEWSANEWRALEFLPGDVLEDDGIRYVTFRFDLATYNPQRSWNSPDSWANPRNFNRFRW